MSFKVKLIGGGPLDGSIINVEHLHCDIYAPYQEPPIIGKNFKIGLHVYKRISSTVVIYKGVRLERWCET